MRLTNIILYIVNVVFSKHCHLYTETNADTEDRASDFISRGTHKLCGNCIHGIIVKASRGQHLQTITGVNNTVTVLTGELLVLHENLI